MEDGGQEIANYYYVPCYLRQCEASPTPQGDWSIANN
jgi:hypothetical protein